MDVLVKSGYSKTWIMSQNQDPNQILKWSNHVYHVK